MKNICQKCNSSEIEENKDSGIGQIICNSCGYTSYFEFLPAIDLPSTEFDDEGRDKILILIKPGINRALIINALKKIKACNSKEALKIINSCPIELIKKNESPTVNFYNAIELIKNAGGEFTINEES